MNFLAHLYLSRHNEELMIGNFIADSVKGKNFDQYPEGVAKGIIMHRAIDTFTDNHSVFLKSVHRLQPKYRKYSGVIMDIFYDHFLAKNWKHYSEEELSDFTKRVHKIMILNRDIMPERTQHFLKYMLLNNIPMPYAEVEGIKKVLYGMSRRAKFESKMEESTGELVEHYGEFENEFTVFMPEARKFVKGYKL